MVSPFFYAALHAPLHLLQLLQPHFLSQILGLIFLQQVVAAGNGLHKGQLEQPPDEYLHGHSSVNPFHEHTHDNGPSPQKVIQA